MSTSMDARLWRALVLAASLAQAACAGTTSTPVTASERPGAAAPATAIPLLAELALPPVAEPVDAPGEDDGSLDAAIGPGLARLATAARATFTAIEPPPGAHPLVCDMVPLAGKLFVSFAVAPVVLDGARIYQLEAAQPGIGPTGPVWTLALDWDRGGKARVTHEVGGQGITRVRAIAGRLWATDADAPLFGGFGLSHAPLEGYVFVSDAAGVFPPLDADMLPPAGTRIAPLAFHVFDIIVYRGALVASGGTVSRLEHGTRYPGGLFVGTLDAPLLEPRFWPGEGWPAGVVRTTYLHRFGGRLYIGFQNNERRARWDLAVLSGEPLDRATPAPVLARVTADGGWLTRRFASGDGTLYWIASGYPRDGRDAVIHASTDGKTFVRIALPTDAGAPQDMVVLGGIRYVLARNGLYRAGADHRFERLAAAPPGDPFGRWNELCSAPLTVWNDALYAGSTRDGTVYRIALAGNAADAR